MVTLWQPRSSKKTKCCYNLPTWFEIASAASTPGHTWYVVNEHGKDYIPGQLATPSATASVRARHYFAKPLLFDALAARALLLWPNGTKSVAKETGWHQI